MLIICLSNSPIYDGLSCFWFWAIMNKASLYIHVQVFYRHLFAFLLSKCLGVNSIGIMVRLYVIFEEQFSKMFVQLCMRLPLDPHPCQHSVMSGILI